MTPVNASKVQILFRWNDGTGAETTVVPTSQGDTVFTATELHVYPPAGECSYTAEAFVVCDGVICTSSSHQEQSFSSWARDNENGGVIQTDPVEALFCEGEDVYVKFRDNSNFNCNIRVEPDKPNRLTRWVQFIYGTQSNAGPRIPNIIVTDSNGVIHQMTDSLGNSLGTFAGPIIPVPINADAPNQYAFPISAPAGGVAGDIFEITMRNWNVCNPYDNKPFDGLPPNDTINGDNPPITTTSLVRIITTPPVINNPKENFCANSSIQISVPQNGDIIRWYTDSLRSNVVYTGSTFDPTLPPVNINSGLPGNYRFWVTNAIGQCESAPSKVDLQIYAMPSPNAGPDRVICDSATLLNAVVPTFGIPAWTTTGTAIIADTLNPKSPVSHLQFGRNRFNWKITNGPCVATDQVVITSDRQPDPANAGADQSFCNTTSLDLNAATPTANGKGVWQILSGGGAISDSLNAKSAVSGLTLGNNQFLWNVESYYKACIPSSDTVRYLVDLASAPANVGPDFHICDTSSLLLSGNFPTNSATGTWSVISGGSAVVNIHQANSLVNNLAEGINRLVWTIASSQGVCPVTRDTVSIVRDLMPDKANAGTSQFLCNVLTSDTMRANPASRGVGQWVVVTNPSAMPPNILPDLNSTSPVMSIDPGDQGLYRLAWLIQNGSCMTSDTISIDFGVPPSPAHAGPDRDTCGLEALLDAEPPLHGWGTWTQVSGPGTVSFLSGRNDPHTRVRINPGEEGVYKIEWKITSGSCPPDSNSFDTVRVVFRPKPLPPVMRDTSHCGPEAFVFSSPLSANATTLRWYDAGLAGNLLSEGDTFATPLLNDNQSYYVSGYNSLSQCESERVKTDITILSVPGMPIAAGEERCGPGTVTITSLLGSGATENRWYSDSITTSFFQTGNDYKDTILNSTTSYYISSFNASNGCESKRREVEAIIHPVPTPPAGHDVGRCGPGSTLLSAAKGNFSTTVRWYDAPVGGTLIRVGDQLYTPVLDSTQSYWISSYNDSTNCESDRAEVTVIINPVPSMPLVTNASSCGPDTVHLTATIGQEGTTNIWYDNISGNNVLSSNQNYSPFLSGSKTFWVSSYNQNTGCESPRAQADATVNPIPNTSDIMGPDVVSKDQTNVVYSVLPNTGSTYQWTIPADVNLILENKNIVILEFPNLGNKTISVQETSASGCLGPLRTKEIQVKQEVVTVKVNIQDSAMCINGPVGLLAEIAGGTPPFIVKWTGDTSYLSSTSVVDPVFSTSQPGDYHLKVTVKDVTANLAEDSVTISIHGLPVTRLPNDTVLCAGERYLITPTNMGGSGYYVYHTWTGSTAFLSRTDIQTPVFISGTKGTFRLGYKVVDTNNCSASDTTAIQVKAPSAKFTTNAQPSCSPVPFSFSNQSDGAVQYVWTFGDGDSSRMADVTHLFVNKGTSVAFYEVELTAIDESGCTNSANQYVQVYPNPDVPITVSPEKACHPANILLMASPGGFSYDWNFGDGQQSAGLYNIFHTYANTSGHDTVYHISLVSKSYFGCLDTSYAQVLVYPSPEAMFTATPDSQMYPQTTVTFNNQTVDANWRYSWDFGDAKTSLLKDPQAHSYDQFGYYKIMLKVTGEHCTDSVEHKIKIVPHPPVAEFNPITPGCMPLTVQFQNYSAYSDTYLWDFGDGSVSNKPNPTYTYYEPGDYQIKLTATGPGGTATATQVGRVFILPHAFFDIAPKKIYVNDENVNFFNMSENADTWLWDFGDGTTSSDTSPQHKYTREGIYNVTLKVMTRNNCIDVYQKEEAVIVESSGKVVYPNVFSPFSKLDENRVFLPGVIDNVMEYHLMIFNRWGEMVFESFDVGTGWDGMYKGKPAKQDAYMWKVVGKYTNGRGFTKTGDVTLLY
jgi:gliding motility-associated-like protein